MGEQILRAKAGEQVFELGAQDAGGNYGLRTFDEPVRQAVLAVLAQLDDATTDTVLSVLKLILTELGPKLEAGGTVNVGNLPASQTVNGTVGVSNSDFPLPTTQVTSLTPQKDALTDAQLRAAAVNVTVSNPTANPETGLAKETTVAAILTELQQKLEAGQSVNVGNFPATQTVSGTVAVSNLPDDNAVLNDIKRDITDYEERFEFDASGNPLYVGKAPDGTLTSATAWTVYKFTFVNGLPERKQVRAGVAWDSRATVGW